MNVLTYRDADSLEKVYTENFQQCGAGLWGGTQGCAEQRRKYMLRRAGRWIVTAVLCLGALTPLTAQITRIDFQTEQRQLLESSQDQQNRDIQQALQQKAERRKLLEASIFELNTLEVKVDPETYIVGPGDMFAVQVLASQTVYLENSVNPEGYLDLPGMGTVFVDGLILNEAREKIRSAAKAVFNQARITVTLTSTRSFMVFLSGEVEFPGAVAVKAGERVVDVLLRVGGIRGLGKLHEVKILRSEGGESREIILDAYAYMQKGDLSQNPVLQAADVIQVPRAQIPDEAVTLQGAAAVSGLFPLRPGETLTALLARIPDFAEKVNIDFVTVNRVDEGVETNLRVDVSGRNRDIQRSDLELRAGDIINLAFLPEIYVYGQVTFPGNYPYVAGYRTIDYLGLAGGNTPEGSMKAYIMRGGESISDLDVTLQRGDIIVVPRSWSNIMIGDLSALTLISTFVSTILSIILITQ